MYESLKSKCVNFHLYVFLFDDKSKSILDDLKLEHVTIVSLAEFENEQLLAVKSSRTKGEYCWTCTPSTIYYCIQKFNLDHCTYIDADLCFYQNPNILVDEMGNSSILITEHRYTRKYDQSSASGIYCVQFITFKNTNQGLKALIWWKDRCIEWCYARIEDGKFGDQKYLDDWTQRFEGVHVLEHLGGGVAPWNVQQYIITEQSGSVLTRYKCKEVPLIFFHFHYVKFYKGNRVDLGSYELSDAVKSIVYRPYIRSILSVERNLQERFSFPRIEQTYFYRNRILSQLHKLYRIIKGVYQVKDVKEFVYGEAD
jgi:hypothetical protein